MCRSICGHLRALRPALHVNLGDTVKFTLINEGQIEHSIDFHNGALKTSGIGAARQSTRGRYKMPRRVRGKGSRAFLP
jgi:hypothetical protein